MIWILLLAGICFSAGVTVPMFILTYPGDECLLFVSARGEALIYGNPAGCHFISYGHVTLILSGKSFLDGKLTNLRDLVKGAITFLQILALIGIDK